MGIYRMKQKVGEHHGIDLKRGAVVVKPGGRIETETDLVAAFPNKFVRLDTAMDDLDGDNQPTIPIPDRFIRVAEVATGVTPPEPISLGSEITKIVEQSADDINDDDTNDDTNDDTEDK